MASAARWFVRNKMKEENIHEKSIRIRTCPCYDCIPDCMRRLEQHQQHPRVQCCTQCRKPELRSGAFRRKGFRPLRKYPERNRSPVAVPDCRIWKAGRCYRWQLHCRTVLQFLPGRYRRHDRAGAPGGGGPDCHRPQPPGQLYPGFRHPGHALPDGRLHRPE